MRSPRGGCGIQSRARVRNAMSAYIMTSDEAPYCVSRFRSAIQFALLRDPIRSLDDAQLAKKRHLAAKLLLEPDLQVLDIRLRLGRTSALSRRDRESALSTGITLSEHQHAIAAAAPPSAASPRRGNPPAGFIATSGAIRPCRLGRHVRACRRRLFMTPSSVSAASCSKTRA